MTVGAGPHGWDSLPRFGETLATMGRIRAFVETLTAWRADRRARPRIGRDPITFSFVEVMAGLVTFAGERFARPIRFRLDVSGGRLRDYFFATATTRAIGRVTVDGFASDAIAEGVLELSPYRRRTIRYAFDFTANDGAAYRFDGHKTIVHWRPVWSWTRLPGSVFDSTGAVVGDAMLRFDLRREFLNLARSFRFSR